MSFVSLVCVCVCVMFQWHASLAQRNWLLIEAQASRLSWYSRLSKSIPRDNHQLAAVLRPATWPRRPIGLGCTHASWEFSLIRSGAHEM